MDVDRFGNETEHDEVEEVDLGYGPMSETMPATSPEPEELTNPKERRNEHWSNKLLLSSEIIKVEIARPVVKHLVGLGEMMHIIGLSKAFKTTTMMELLTCIVLGIPFLDFFETLGNCTAIFLSDEDLDHIPGRANALEEKYGLSPKVMYPRDHTLMPQLYGGQNNRDQAYTRLSSMVGYAQDKAGLPVRAIGFDALKGMIHRPDGKKPSADDYGNANEMLMEFLDNFDKEIAFIVDNHMTKNGKEYLGSGKILSDVTGMLKNSIGDVNKITLEKCKIMDSGGYFPFEAEETSEGIAVIKSGKYVPPSETLHVETVEATGAKGKIVAALETGKAWEYAELAKKAKRSERHTKKLLNELQEAGLELIVTEASKGVKKTVCMKGA